MSILKADLRKHFRNIRDNIDLAYKNFAADAAATFFISQDLFQQSEHIACYLPVKNEFDSMPIINAIWQAKKQCYLPVLTNEKSLRFISYRKDDVLHLNQYGIPEPTGSIEIMANQLDLVITPLIAFDLQGQRLGTGGGYYDRTFSFLKQHAIKPVLIGLAYAYQQTESISAEEWDIPIQAVITEKEFKLLTRYDQTD